MPATCARPSHPEDALLLAGIADAMIADPAARPTVIMRRLDYEAHTIRRLQRHWRRHHRALLSAAARRRGGEKGAGAAVDVPVTASMPTGYTVEVLVDPIAMLEHCRRTGATHVRLRVIAEDVR